MYDSSRKTFASAVASAIIFGSMIILANDGSLVGTQREGKSGPNMGIRAPAMGAQNVAQMARAQAQGIQ